MSDCIEAMKVAFGDDSEVPQRVMLGSSLFMPARVGESAGIKVVGVAPGNPVGVVVVFDAGGNPVGVVDGPTVTAMRTAAGAGLATDLLAPPDASTLAMLGAGAMAADQVEAVRSVRPIDRVLIWSRTADRAHALAEQIDDGEVVLDAGEAVAQADVVTTATPATRPLFDGDSVRAGTHLNAIGAFTPEMCEIPPETVRAAFVVVDDLDAAAEEAGDVIQAGKTPDATVGDLLAGRATHAAEPITLFKSVGIGSQDVAAAATALVRAAERGIGTTF